MLLFLLFGTTCPYCTMSTLGSDVTHKTPDSQKAETLGLGAKTRFLRDRQTSVQILARPLRRTWAPLGTRAHSHSEIPWDRVGIAEIGNAEVPSTECVPGACSVNEQIHACRGACFHSCTHTPSMTAGRQATYLLTTLPDPRDASKSMSSPCPLIL